MFDESEIANIKRIGAEHKEYGKMFKFNRQTETIEVNETLVLEHFNRIFEHFPNVKKYTNVKLVKNEVK